MHVAQGDRVEAGQLVIEADLDAIRVAGYDLTTPVVVTNSDRFTVEVPAAGDITTGEPFATIKEKELTGGTA